MCRDFGRRFASSMKLGMGCSMLLPRSRGIKGYREPIIPCGTIVG